MQYIYLTDDDIVANRLGQLSERQRELIRTQRLVWIAGTLGLAGIVLGLLIVLVIKYQNPAFANRGELFVFIPVLLFWIWILRLMPHRWHLANLDLRDGRINTIEGMVQTDIKFGYGFFRSIRHYIYVQDHSFHISSTQKRLFKPDQVYRIYHTQHGFHFLGAVLLVKVMKDQDPPSSLIEPLTARELTILQLIASGMTNQEIAVQLSLSVNTIKMYISQLYRKLDVNRRTEAVARSRELNLF